MRHHRPPVWEVIRRRQLRTHRQPGKVSSREHALARRGRTEMSTVASRPRQDETPACAGAAARVPPDLPRLAPKTADPRPRDTKYRQYRPPTSRESQARTGSEGGVVAAGARAKLP